MVYLLSVKKFSIPSFLLHLTLSRSNKLTEKTNQIHHKQAIKIIAFFLAHAATSLQKPNFPIQSLPCFPVPGSSAKRKTQSKGRE